MTSQTPGRGQRNELNPAWPRNSQPQMNSGSASGTLSSWGAGPSAEQTFAGYQYSSTLARHQHLNSTHLVSSSYEPADTGAHPSLPPLHAHRQVEFAGFPNSQDGSNRHSSVAGALPKTPAAKRKIRARQPAPDEWEHHKSTIELLYLRQNLSLADTMTEMSATHQFYATEKMYKDKFKQWKWSKNLPKDMAMAMLNKAKQRQPKQTIFQWGNQTWTIERIKKTHGKFADQSESHFLESYPTPQDATCETPYTPGITDTPNAPEETQGHDGDPVLACGVAADAATMPSRTIDEGPFPLNLNQASAADLTSAVKAALDADGKGNEEEAELGLRDALSCSSRLLSPTHRETVKIGYLLASFYANKGRKVDTDDILNWMTNKHLTRFGLHHPKTVAHVFRIISLLRLWLRHGDAESLIYRLLESQKDPEEYHLLLQNTTRPDTVSKEFIGDLLASGDVDRLGATLDVLEALAIDSDNHEFLQGLLPQIIETCDGFQQTHGKPAIQSRCILAEILVKGAQYESARNTLRGGGRHLKQQIDAKSPMEPPTLKLLQRVAFTFLEANDPETCDKVLERVAAVVDANVGVERDGPYDIVATEFLISTASGLQGRCTWERGRPWVERALSLSYSLFGRCDGQTKRLEKILETGNIEGSWDPKKADLEDFMNNTGKELVIRVYSS
ncbi:hypothetical protein MHUMG1_07670 [Metarhizium humberi]|uniref:Clr5 domain-containing protein n=1 Tax=Metarhizium humberi TaxID=2596975 RepID=A0A9P8MA54_9HYPO|nr:hypothetical protein MHUMG1_07670 [Metarhizium humberi]